MNGMKSVFVLLFAFVFLASLSFAASSYITAQVFNSAGSGSSWVPNINVNLYYTDTGDMMSDLSSTTSSSGSPVGFTVDVNRPFKLNGYNSDRSKYYGKSGGVAGEATKEYILKLSGSSYQLCDYRANTCTGTSMVPLYPNQAPAPVQQSLPDVTVTSFSYNPDSTGDGICDSFSINFKNNGPGSLNSVVTAIVKVNGVQKYVGTYSPDNSNYFPIASGGTWFDRITYSQLGAHASDSVEVYLDSSNTIQESNENNNNLVGTFLPVSAGGCSLPTVAVTPVQPTYPSTFSSTFSVYVYGQNGEKISNAYLSMYKVSDNSRVRGFYTDSNGEVKFTGNHFEDNVNVYFKAEKDGYTYDSLDGRVLAFVDTGTTAKGFCDIVNGRQNQCNKTGYALTSVTAPVSRSVTITVYAQPDSRASDYASGVNVQLKDSNGNVLQSGTTNVNGYATFTITENTQFYLDSTSGYGDSWKALFGYSPAIEKLTYDTNGIVKLVRTQDGATMSSPFNLYMYKLSVTTPTPTCSDSDGGENVYTKGTISGTFSPGDAGAAIVRSHNNDEYCVNSRTVAENYCSASNYITGRDITCPTGYSCSDGACVQQTNNKFPVYVYSETFAQADAAYPHYNPTLVSGVTVYAYRISDNGYVMSATTNSNGIAYFTLTSEPVYFKAFKGSNNYLPPGILVSSGYYYDSNQGKMCGKYSDGRSGCEVTGIILYGVTSQTTTTNVQCTDSDGSNIYTKGTVTGLDYYGTSTLTIDDGCSLSSGGAETSSGAYVMEETCQANGKTLASYSACPTGYSCNDGACKQTTQTTPTTPVGSEVKFEVGVNGYPENQNNIDGYVNIYKVTSPIGKEYKGYLIETIKAPASEGAGFIVGYNQIVNFVGFKSYDKAVAATVWTFNTPPYKNFGVTDQLCQTNYENTAQYLKNSKDYSCASSLGTPYADGQTNSVTPVVVNATVITPTSSTYTLVLEKGWNQLSVPFISGKLTGNSCSGNTIFLYDTLGGQYKKTTLTGDIQGFNNLGFWMKATEPCKLQFETAPGFDFYYSSQIEQMRNDYGSGVYKLYAGWNMIGAPYDGVDFSTIKGSCEVKSGPWNFNPSSNNWKKADGFKAGEGYFIKVAADCTLGSSDAPPAPPN
ncbi:MAG: CARDB domain-containing protein [Candidatus Micrarchaeota archaeon]|nr:CARDB domain-containing protein [Candidatus Micrarchaeota archaeon]